MLPTTGVYLIKFTVSVLQNNFVSSAYITILNTLLTRGKSCIHITKSSGPSTEPCGTPVSIDNFSDLVPLYSTN